MKANSNKKKCIGIIVLVSLLGFFLYPAGNLGETKPGENTNNEFMSKKRPPEEKDFTSKRAEMVKLIKYFGIKDIHVISAMSNVRRHLYIPKPMRRECDPYGNHPCPIGYGQTISQPLIVAYMTEKLRLKKSEKVLEIGTGSGYQAAILAEMGADVYSIEIIPGLYAHARDVLTAEGYTNVHLLRGDGYQGWPEHAPFDAVIVTCAPENVPEKLVEQLKEGGRMIVPVGTGNQRLVIFRKEKSKITRINDIEVRFVPMVHEKK
ncbi:MAG: protein-L-isoaspartate(D-aspartate) O-methyltransferase [Acidobacteria bacterium]|jgi:protein-L-isoaspartate(D-aspartate) O-methyltransferase|nr:protein-L-isoaspartate(D-aspartate) O-methyltransferase [Acidobacteriota bacterium]